MIKEVFDRAVDKEVQRRMDEFYHRHWLEERLDDLRNRIDKLEAKVFIEPKLLGKQDNVVYTESDCNCECPCTCEPE